MERFVCENCGFWQEEMGPPTDCPVCDDYRHTRASVGLTMLSVDDVRQRYRTIREKCLDSVHRLRTEPLLGIGPNGYLIESKQGNFMFEAAPWIDDAMLEWVKELGGVTWLSASHPHSYGCLWRVQRELSARVYLNRADLGWTKSLRVDCPIDAIAEMTGGRLIQTGGHFDGHTILYLEEQQLVFVGDLLKLHFRLGKLTGMSTHKAFNRRIPLIRAELQTYLAILVQLKFRHVFTTFDAAPLTNELVGRFLRCAMERPPGCEPISIEDIPEIK